MDSGGVDTESVIILMNKIPKFNRDMNKLLYGDVIINIQKYIIRYQQKILNIWKQNTIKKQL